MPESKFNIIRNKHNKKEVIIKYQEVVRTGVRPNLYKTFRKLFGFNQTTFKLINRDLTMLIKHFSCNVTEQSELSVAIGVIRL